MGPTELWSMVSEILGRVSHKRRRDPRFVSRGDYSVWHVLKVILFGVVHRISIPSLYRKLEKPGFLRAAGLPNRMISQSQIYKRMSDPMTVRALLELLQQSAQRALREAGEEEVRILPMDLTAYKSHPDRDPLAAWGFTSGGHFWGYKLGLILSKSGLVLGMTLTRGNWTEFTVVARLLRMARETIRGAFGSAEVHYVVADAGFDGEKTYREAWHQLGAVALCPARRKRNPKAKSARKILRNARRRCPYRWRSQTLWKSEEARQVYRKRNSVEQVNGQIKAVLKIDEIPSRRRGVRRLRLLSLAKLFIYNCALYVNIQKGQPARQIAHLVA